MSAIDDLKDHKVAVGDWLTQAYAILELDARVKELEERFVNHRHSASELPEGATTLEDWFIDHVQKYHSIQYPPKTATPTDEDLLDKYCTLIYSNLSLTLSDLTVVRNCLIQLIAEVRS